MNSEIDDAPINRDVLARQLLSEANSLFDMEEVQANDEIYRLLTEIENIAESGETAEESDNLTIENDFNDHDFYLLENRLQSAFTSDLLKKCAVSRITIRPDIIHLAIGKGLYLTSEQYQAWSKANPMINRFKVRAENFTTLQTTGWIYDNYGVAGEIPLPIVVYGFDRKEIENIKHLASLENDLKMKEYKLGTVTHEIRHHIFQFILTPEQREQFVHIATNTDPLTEYSDNYHGTKIYSEEQFCEGVRLMTTNPRYLNEHAPMIYNFFEEALPDIHPFSGQLRE